MIMGCLNSIWTSQAPPRHPYFLHISIQFHLHQRTDKDCNNGKNRGDETKREIVRKKSWSTHQTLTLSGGILKFSFYHQLFLTAPKQTLFDRSTISFFLVLCVFLFCTSLFISTLGKNQFARAQ